MSNLNHPPQPGQLIAVACGGEMVFKPETPWAIYNGEPVAFCTQACLNTFNDDPGPFMAGEIAHPVD